MSNQSKNRARSLGVSSKGETLNVNVPHKADNQSNKALHESTYEEYHKFTVTKSLVNSYVR